MCDTACVRLSVCVREGERKTERERKTEGEGAREKRREGERRRSVCVSGASGGKGRCVQVCHSCLHTTGDGKFRVVGSQLLNTDSLLHRPFWEQVDK